VALLSRSSLSGSLEGPSGYWPQMLVYGLATAAAFTLMFAALKRIGSSRTAVVMTLEAFFAIVLTAIFLGESVGVVQAVGGVAILGAAAIIGLSPTARGRPEGTVIRQEVAG
jgi:drug/metabolite transporter (DMT)-like permease